MSNHPPSWADTLIRLLALASRLEREGQYNVAKLARAAADALGRQAAYRIDLPPDREVLVQETEQLAATFAEFGGGDELAATLQRGATGLREGRFTLISETPDAFVCRTCGAAVIDEPTVPCPVCGAWAETFQRWLPVYWLNDLEPLAAIDRLRRTAQAVAALLDVAPAAILEREPAQGAWSVRNAVSHLRDAQGVLVQRLELMLAQDDPPLTALAVFAWAQQEAADPPSTRAILAEYLAGREQLLAMLSALPLSDWWRTGRHEEFGVVTAKQGSYPALYGDDAVEISKPACEFLRAGLDARHLRTWRTSAEREASLYEQIVTPRYRQRNPESRAEALAQLRRLDTLGGVLRAAMTRQALRHHFEA